MKTKFNEFAKLEFDVDDVISKIEIYSNSINIRKSTNYINNILINSELCKFYKDYYVYNDVKVKKLPVPESIYDFEELFLRLDLELNKNKNYLYNNMIFFLKEYLVYINYFPYVLDYRDKQWEVDFIVAKDGKVKQLIQVSYNISSEKTLKREINGLVKAAKKFKCENLVLINFDEEKEVKANGHTIQLVPAAEWLVNNK